ncbi:hypothetical protein DFH09DRAFT_1184893 [Mycena vulgaris]|nr:hypothetical protein DFH09DRAFT_1184893 [Mycena vulgaris]
MTEGLSVSPTLPLELERKIFELAALSRPVCIPNLMRVAWRVQHWVEPLLYRTLVVGTTDMIDGILPRTFERFTHIANTKSASFLQASVRNLMIVNIPVKQRRTVLSACTGVDNLWIAYDSEPSDYYTAVLLGLESFTHPSFSHLTHLELLNGLAHDDEDDDDPAPWVDLTRLAHLTHLSVDAFTVLAVCPYLLDACKCLRALIVLGSRPRSLSAKLEVLATDPRSVGMSLDAYRRDWQRGVLHGVDYWACADVFIAKRISGEVDRDMFWLSDEDGV